MLDSRDMALHGVQGVELDEANLAVKCLLVPLLLLLRHRPHGRGRLAEAEAGGQTETLHLGQGLAVHSIAINLSGIFNLQIILYSIQQNELKCHL